MTPGSNVVFGSCGMLELVENLRLHEPSCGWEETVKREQILRWASGGAALAFPKNWIFLNFHLCRFQTVALLTFLKGKFHYSFNSKEPEKYLTVHHFLLNVFWKLILVFWEKFEPQWINKIVGLSIWQFVVSAKSREAKDFLGFESRM